MLTGSTNEEKIKNYLKSKGLPDVSVYGLMGNLKAESGCNPMNLQNSCEKRINMSDVEYTQAVDNGTYKNFVKDSAGYGLAQWTYWNRKHKLLSFAQKEKKSIGDLEMQLDFLIHELKTSYKPLWRGLLCATTILDASNLVLLHYEKPANQSIQVQNLRASYGEAYRKQFEKPGAVQASANSNIKVGSMVKVKADAKTYDGKSLSKIVFTREHKVHSIKNDRVVITYNGIVVAAVKLSDLTFIK